MSKKKKVAKPLPEQAERAKRGAAGSANSTRSRKTSFEDKNKYKRERFGEKENDNEA